MLVDSTDPVGPATPLFGPNFYGDVHRVLGEDGIVVSQAESPWAEPEAQRSLLAILSGIYPTLHLYNYVNMTYPGGLWSFSFAAKGKTCPLADFAPSRVAASGIDFRYYNPAVHRAAFALPTFQLRELESYLTPLEA